MMRTRPNVSQCSRSRLLHHIAQLPRSSHLALTVEHLHLGLQNCSAHLRPRKTSDEADLALLMRHRVAELRHSENLTDILAGDDLLVLRAVLHHTPRNLAAHIADLALQVPDPSLTRIAANNLFERIVLKDDLSFSQSRA